MCLAFLYRTTGQWDTTWRARWTSVGPSVFPVTWRRWSPLPVLKPSTWWQTCSSGMPRRGRLLRRYVLAGEIASSHWQLFSPAVTRGSAVQELENNETQTIQTVFWPRSISIPPSHISHINTLRLSPAGSPVLVLPRGPGAWDSSADPGAGPTSASPPAPTAAGAASTAPAEARAPVPTSRPLPQAPAADPALPRVGHHPGGSLPAAHRPGPRAATEAHCKTGSEGRNATVSPSFHYWQERPEEGEALWDRNSLLTCRWRLILLFFLFFFQPTRQESENTNLLRYPLKPKVGRQRWGHSTENLKGDDWDGHKGAELTPTSILGKSLLATEKSRQGEEATSMWGRRGPGAHSESLSSLTGWIVLCLSDTLTF